MTRTRTIAAIIQARMGSTRLPGKVLSLLCGEPVLAHIVRRVGRASIVDRIIVATSDASRDDTVADAAQRVGAEVFRGSEEDVLSRYVGAARMAGTDAVVRITADCPLLDPALLKRMIFRFQALSRIRRVDYLSNTLVRTFPRGLDLEILTYEALERASHEAKHHDEREHVTLYIYRHPERFHLESFVHPVDLSHHRWTLDTPEDLAFIRQVYALLYPNDPFFSMEAVLSLLDSHPGLYRPDALPAHRAAENT